MFSLVYVLFSIDAKFTAGYISVLYKAVLFLAFKGEAGNRN